MRVFLGFDTSCYTTSLAAVDESGEIVYDGRSGLEVPAGQRGLRQSEALFQHIRHLGPLAEELRSRVRNASVSHVTASACPRPTVGSYLPVFLAGMSAARVLAAGAGVSYSETSHQEGHLRAALLAAEPPSRFLALHLSGGTTEIMAASARPSGYDLEILGGTDDLHAGQFVDRIGVAMGLPFPAGAALEKTAADGRRGIVSLPVAVKEAHMSFSGPLSAAERALRAGAARADLAAATFECLTESVGRALGAAAGMTGLQDVVLCGGVSANRWLRLQLPGMLPGMRLIFADRGLATDNAVGVALLALERWREES